MPALQSLLFCNHCFAVDPPENEPAEVPTIESIQKALLALEDGDPVDCDLLYENYPLESLDEISRGTIDHRAVMAQWKLAIQLDKNATPTLQDPVKLSREKIQRFIGFVEGRLQIDLPKWWEETACTAISYGPEYLLHLEVQKSPKWRMIPKTYDWLHDNIKTASCSDRKLTVVLRNRQDPVLMNFKNESPTVFFLNGRISCFNVVDQSGLYVTIHPSMGEMYKIAKFKSNGESIVWSRNVWTMPGPPGGGSGMPLQGHYSEMIFTKSTVYVVGATPGAAPGVIYIEGFSRADGHPVIRFTSEYR